MMKQFEIKIRNKIDRAIGFRKKGQEGKRARGQAPPFPLAFLRLFFLFSMAAVNVAHSDAELSVSITASNSINGSYVVSVGQTVKVTMTVQNTGDSAANDVNRNELVITGNGGASKISGPTPQTIPARGKRDFEWIYKANVAGTITFSGSASGTSADTGASIFSASGASNDMTIQTPPDLRITLIAVSDKRVSVGQYITVIMNIRNHGGATAKDVTPFIDLTGEGGVKRTDDPSPNRIDLIGGHEHYFTWKYQAISSGTVTFFGSASGIDSNSSFLISTGLKAAEPAVTIKIPAALSITITAESFSNPNVEPKAFGVGEASEQITEGQNITVTMVVKNTGEVTANNVTPSVQLKTGQAIYESGPNPPPGTDVEESVARLPKQSLSAFVEGGRSKTFTWNYKTKEGNAGIVVFSGIVKGKDADTNDDIKSSEVESNKIVVQKAPKLTATLTAKNPQNNIKTQISEGQTITVTMTVQNAGDATAINVRPSELKLAGDGNAKLASGPILPEDNSHKAKPLVSEASILSGGSITFTWTYITTAGNAGSITFSGSAGGMDFNTGNVVEASKVTSNAVTIQTPAHLNIISLTAEHPDKPPPTTQVGEGQTIKVTMTVKNYGQAKALNLQPKIELSGTGKATLLIGPSPVDIEGGVSATFEWIYNTKTGDAGVILFSGEVSASDFNSKALTSDAEISNQVLIQKPAALLISHFIAEHPGNPDVARISEGQTITCSATVTNKGEARANDVGIATPTWPGKGSATLISSPSPANADIEVGENQTYTWTWQTNPGTATPPLLKGAGGITFSVSASGKDHNSGTHISTSRDSKPMLIQTDPKLRVTLEAEPAQISEGQSITIIMTVINEDIPETSQATAVNIAPSKLNLGESAGHATFHSGPDPESPLARDAFHDAFYWAEGESRSFTCTYTTTSGDYGDVTFWGSASGTDENSGEPIHAPNRPSNRVLIQIPAALEIIEIKAEPMQISEGQDITVAMTVRNTGEAIALNVLPSHLDGIFDNIEKTAFATVKETPIAKNIPGGKTEIFRWVYETRQFQHVPNYEIDDTITFTGTTTGIDYNSQETISAGEKTSNPVVIQMPANLQVEMDLSTSKIFEGQSFQVKVTVRNIGEADAENVFSLKPKWSGTGKVFLVSSPKIKSLIPGGSQHTFAWEFSTEEGESHGAVTFTGKAEGKDFNTKKTVKPDLAESPINAVVQPLSPQINIDVQPPRSISLRPKISVDIGAGRDKTRVVDGLRPVQVSAGQKFNITMMVKNERTIDVAINVVPSQMEITGTGDFARLKALDIQPKRIEPQKTATYIWEYQTSEADVGVISFKGDAIGENQVTNHLLGWFEKVESEPVIVQRPAKLTSRISIQQRKISEGQKFTVTMTVTNDSEAMVEEVKPVCVQRTGRPSELSIFGESVAELLFGPEPASAKEILGGKSYQYTWTYKAVAEGYIAFEGNANGFDANSGDGVESEVTLSEISEIVRPLALESKFTVSKELISEGQTLIVTMTVKNTSGADAKEVEVPSSLVIVGKAAKTSGPTLESGPHPQKVDIPAGESKTYTWRYMTTTSDAAKIIFSGNATGIDAITGERTSSLLTISPEVTILTPAHLVSQVKAACLSADMAAPPEEGERRFLKPISGGQIITVTLTVTNDGQAKALGVRPSNPELMRGGLISAKPIEGPNPESVDELKSGASFKFTWEYQTQAGDAGIVVFAANANGYEFTDARSGLSDENSQRTIQSDKTLSNDIYIQIPALLEVSLEMPILGRGAAPTRRISAGQSVDITMTVKNTGEATAIEVQPSSWTVKIGELEPQPIQIAHEPITISGGGQKIFSWPYTAPTDIAEETLVSFRGNVTGKDGNSNQTVNSEFSAPATVTIIPLPVLTITAFTVEGSPQISEGQTITVRMKVKNNGMATVVKVRAGKLTGENPLHLIVEGSGKVAYESGPSEHGNTIKPKDEQEYSWRYSTTSGSAGVISFKGRAEGIDELSGALVSSAEQTSTTLTIQRPARLTSMLTVEPPERCGESGCTTAFISEGQEFRVTLTVTNDGEAIAKNVTPSTLELRGQVNLKSKEPASIFVGIDLAANESHNFTWSYKTRPQDNDYPGDAGTVRFQTSASGYDENSYQLVQSEKITSPDITIQIPAKLEVTLEVDKKTITAGQPLLVTMTVTNTGQAAVLDVIPSLTLLDHTDTKNIKLLEAPEPEMVDILGSKSWQFQWIYTTEANSEGEATVIGHAKGRDANSNGTLKSPQVTVKIVQGPMLVCSLRSPTTSSYGSLRSPTASAYGTLLKAEHNQISEGQDIFVEMAVRNAGQATAEDVVPELTIEGDGFAELMGNPPSSVDIEPQTEQIFRWQYATIKDKSAGYITFIGKAIGVNAESPLRASVNSLSKEIVVESNSCKSNPIHIQQPAHLLISKFTATPINACLWFKPQGMRLLQFASEASQRRLQLSPQQISEGQQIRVQMEVKNEDPKEKKERATAEVTAPVELNIIGAGRASSKKSLTNWT